MTLTRSLVSFWLMLLISALPAGAAERFSIESEKTEKGHSYWFVPNQSAKRTAIAILWPSTDLSKAPEGKEGIALLGTKLMLYGGAGKLDSQQLIAKFNDLGAMANIRAESFEVGALVVAPSDTLLDAARYLNLSLASPKLDASWLKRIRRRILADIREKQIKTSAMLWRAARQSLMGDDRYTRAVNFDPDGVIGSIEHADIGVWHKAAFDQDGAIVVAVGNAEPALVGKAIDRILSGLPKAAPKGAKPAPFPKLNIRPKTIVLKDPGREKSAILMLGRVPPRTEGISLKATLASKALGGSVHSRLFQALRSELGLTYRVKSRLVDFTRSQRVLAVLSEFEVAKAGQALDSLRKTYAKFQREGLGADEFAALKERALLDQKKFLQRPLLVANAILGARASGRDIEAAASVPSRLKAITREALNAHIAAKLPQLDEMLTIILTPDPEGLKADCVINAPSEASGC